MSSGGSGSSFIPDTLRLSAYQPSATARKVVQLLPGFSTVDANGQSRPFQTSVVGGTNAPSGDSVVITTRSDYELGASGNLLSLHTVDNFGRDEREYHHEFGFIDNLGNRTLFVRDMLGSTRAVLKNGTMVEWNDYYAYGAVRDGASLINGRWKYLGLEFDNETGSTHTAAREYFALEGFFNKPDRFEFKYPSHTTYGYAKQNPFLYHDASGDTIRIIDNGKTYTYTSGMTTPEGASAWVSTLISAFNAVHTTEVGNQVLGDLEKAEGDYEYTVGQVKEGAAGATRPTDKGSRTTFGNASEVNFKTITHESFHQYQNLKTPKNLRRPSIHREVEAYLFTFAIQISLGMTSSTMAIDDTYDKEFNKLVDAESFNANLFNRQVSGFKQKSGHNANGIYNLFPKTVKGQPYLLKDLYPLIRIR